MFRGVNTSNERSYRSCKDVMHRKLFNKRLFPEECKRCEQWGGDRSGQLGLYLRDTWKWWRLRVMTAALWIQPAFLPFMAQKYVSLLPCSWSLEALGWIIISLTVRGWCAALEGLEEASSGKTCSGLSLPLWANRPGGSVVRNPGNRWLMFWEFNVASKIKSSISQAWIPSARAAIGRQTCIPSAWTAASFRLWHPDPEAREALPPCG